jgi:hypothetical protein
VCRLPACGKPLGRYLQAADNEVEKVENMNNTEF